MIIDTHVHVLSPDLHKYPRAVDAPAWPDTTDEMLLRMMDDAGVDRAVLVQTYFIYGYDNRYLADCCRRHADRFIGVCTLDPLGKDTPAQLQTLVEQGGISGVRLFNVEKPPADWLDDARTFPLWENAQALGIPICVATRYPQLHRVETMLRRFPGVRVALDHTWEPKLDGGPPYGVLNPLATLATHQNFRLKIASNTFHAASKGSSTTHAYLQELLKCVGPQRIMWGSNYPTHDEFGNLAERVQRARHELACFSQQETESALGTAALGLWPMLR